MEIRGVGERQILDKIEDFSPHNTNSPRIKSRKGLPDAQKLHT